MSMLIETLFEKSIADQILTKIGNGANWMNARRDILRIIEDVRNSNNEESGYTESDYFAWFYTNKWRQTQEKVNAELKVVSAKSTIMMDVLSEFYGISNISGYNYILKDTVFGQNNAMLNSISDQNFSSIIEKNSVLTSADAIQAYTKFKLRTKESAKAFTNLYILKKTQKIEKLMGRNDRPAHPITSQIRIAINSELDPKHDKVLIEMIKQLITRVKLFRDQDLLYDMIIAGKQQYEDLKERETTIFNLKNIKFDQEVDLHTAEVVERNDFDEEFERFM